MAQYLLKNATIINEGKSTVADVLITGKRIEKIGSALTAPRATVFDLSGKYLIPGMIDDQVHFREPGLVHKATIFSESRACAAGGITSFMEMPNTKPAAVTQQLLEEKYLIASQSAHVNYSFFMGATNDNLDEVLKTNGELVCGIKVFMGSSTGNMLVDDEKTLNNLFSKCPLLIATHCEDEMTIRKNLEAAKQKYGEAIPVSMHPVIRSEEACYLSSSRAVELAKKHNTRLHVLHISTAKETELFVNNLPLEKKKITAEVCVHHLWFSDKDYAEKGNFIKWNPAIKTENDREGIWRAVLEDKVDILATDHAPHTLKEKSEQYLNAPSGGPLVQHALIALFEKVKEGKITAEKLVEKIAHAPAKCFNIVDRGFIREGYFADLVIINPAANTAVTKEHVLSKCGWSPFEGTTFSHQIESTFVNGALVYHHGNLIEHQAAERLRFNQN
ncbi:MAG: dihydroorotase [Crocinitomicaceae bacterium]|nr:dihydroorotase [Crocinitomicaceae bacterium]MBK8926464.1 dihydroorotase [Crocinitomicaceae bacterium]